MIKMIAAVSINGVIGIDGIIPWMGRFKEDMKFFREMTKNSIVIMGRKTFQSLNLLPLSGRENRVVGTTKTDVRIGGTSYAQFASLKEAIEAPNPDSKDIWLIGGEGIYTEGLAYAQEVYTTLIPEAVDTTAAQSVSRFPWIHPLNFDRVICMVDDLVKMENTSHLAVAIYRPSMTTWH